MACVPGLPAAPIWSAAFWVASEALRSRVPWGGLPWGRVGFGQPDGPLVHLAALGGGPLLSFVTVLGGLALGELVRRAVARSGRRALAVPLVIGLVAFATGPLAAL